MEAVRSSSPRPASDRPNSLRLDQKTLELLLDRIDKQEPRTSRAPGRQFTRCEFRHVCIPITVTHPGGTRASLTLASRNLSSTGISLLHSSYVHTGSACELELPRAFAGSLRLAAKVVRCRQIAGVVHELGIEFAKPISVREIVRHDTLSEFFSLESVNPTDLQGSILHCEASAIDQQLLRHFLSGTQLRIRTATSIAEALPIAKEGVSLILTDSSLKDGDAVELMQRLRSDLVACPVIFTTNDSNSEARTRLRQACPDGFLAKPLTQDRLLRGLAELLLLETPITKSAGASKDGDTSGLDVLVESFISELQRKAQHLTACLRTNDVASCLSACREIRGTAPSLGFNTVAKLAERAEKTIASVGSLAESARQIQELINGCARAAR